MVFFLPFSCSLRHIRHSNAYIRDFEFTFIDPLGCCVIILSYFLVVVSSLLYAHGKLLLSCQDAQLSEPHYSRIGMLLPPKWLISDK